MQIKRRAHGFTLIELLIALVLVAILAAIALPSYQDSVRKSRRSDAVTALTNIQLAQEKYRANNSTYGTLAQLGLSSTSTEGYYTLTITGNSATAFTATATAGGAQASDTACATLVLDQDGPDVSTAAKRACWSRN